MKPLLVGEANPYQRDEETAMRYALHPDPLHASGGRLCHVIMGITERDYLRWYDRIDLCHPKWSMPKARAAAARIVAERTADDVIVLCGAKVAGAFGFAPKSFEIYRGFDLVDADVPTILRLPAPTFVTIPHPSGLNRAWHVPGAIQRARDVLRSAGALPEVSA